MDLHRKLGQEDDPQALALLHDWGATLVAAGDPARALELLQRVWERRSATIGPTHPDTLATRSLLAYAKQVGGDLDAAMADIQGVVQDQVKTVGPNDRATLESMCSLADMLGSAGKHEEALRVAREVSTRAAASSWSRAISP
jgi:Flp pilus assembly protein TadD